MIADEVPAALDGERLDRVVALLADVSRSVAAELIAGGAVHVDGDVATSGKVRLTVGAQRRHRHDGDPLAALPVRRTPTSSSASCTSTTAVVVVDKPAGLVVHPGAGNPDGTLVNGLLARFPDIAGVGDTDRPGIVHRLDAGSSGLLVVARTAAASESLIGQFAAHTATRRYVALVWGHPAAAHGIVDAPIGRDPADPTKMAVVADGRPARTEYEVVEELQAPADVALLAVAWRPVAPTRSGSTWRRSGIHSSATSSTAPGRSTLGLARPFLHAAELSFDHPTSGERVTLRERTAADLDRRCVDERCAG